MDIPMQISFREWDNSALARRSAASLGGDEVQVWLATMPADEAGLNALALTLNPDECERAERFRVSEPRRQFVFGRGVLRQLLGACLNIDPVALVICCQPHGKPFLDVAGDLRFNLSHSGRMVAVALARGREVGVDIESIQRLDDWPLLASRIFSPRELGELKSIPEPQQRAAFFNGWTRKEAYLKATGEGLTDNLLAVEVALATGEPKLLGLPAGPDAARRWAIHSMPLPPDFAGAVVFEKCPGSGAASHG
jgi:4'-phosphopantetheinyl transferase